LSVGLVAGLFAFVFLVFVPRYETNDDPIMTLMASGHIFSDRPDEHLLFTNVLIGLPLRWLYENSNSFPWYGCYLLGSFALSLVGVCYAFLRPNHAASAAAAAPTGYPRAAAAAGSAERLLRTLIFLIFFGLPCLVMPQFTRVAFTASLAGLLLLLTAADARTALRLAVPAGLMLMLGSLIRLESCWLACIVLSPALVYSWLSGPVRRTGLQVLVLAGALALGFGADRLNGWYYSRDEGWAQFYEFNALRAQFTDYSRVEYNERTRVVLESVGWSKIDLVLLTEFNYADPERFSTERLRTVLNAVGARDRVTEGRSLGVIAGRLLTDADLLALLIAGGVCLAFMGGGYRRRAVPLLSLLVAVGISLLLWSYFRVPPRVYFPAFAGWVAVAIALSSGSGSLWTWSPRAPGGVLRAASLVLLGGMLVWRVGGLFVENARDLAQHRATTQMMASLPPPEDRLFVIWTGVIKYEYLVYPLESANVPPQFRAIDLLIANPRVPPTARQLRRLGITDLYRALFEHPDVYVFSSNYLNHLLLTYLEEHYRVRLGFRVKFAHPALEAGYCCQLEILLPDTPGLPTKETERGRK
jgi:hypothetical protein